MDIFLILTGYKNKLGLVTFNNDMDLFLKLTDDRNTTITRPSDI
jgi:hypothetical protein